MTTVQHFSVVEALILNTFAAAPASGEARRRPKRAGETKRAVQRDPARPREGQRGPERPKEVQRASNEEQKYWKYKGF